jgi:hypothetical protein
VREPFDRYSDCLVAQLLQSSACNAAHPIEQRTAKWLRFALDHTGAKEVPLTQDQLANVLGVSRTYVSRVISRLKTAGVLGTRRGTLCIRDPDMLRRLCCGCHDAVYQHFEAVLGGVYPGVQTRCDPWAPKLPLHSALYPHGEPAHAKGS